MVLNSVNKDYLEIVNSYSKNESFKESILKDSSLDIDKMIQYLENYANILKSFKVLSNE